MVFLIHIYDIDGCTTTYPKEKREGRREGKEREGDKGEEKGEGRRAYQGEGKEKNETKAEKKRKGERETKSENEGVVKNTWERTRVKM